MSWQLFAQAPLYFTSVRMNIYSAIHTKPYGTYFCFTAFNFGIEPTITTPIELGVLNPFSFHFAVSSIRYSQSQPRLQFHRVQKLRTSVQVISAGALSITVGDIRDGLLPV